jgi:RNA polymerase sigma-70 factor (ECF subfamily)
MGSPEESTEQFERIVREHGPALERLASGYAADTSDQEDLLQDIMFAIWRALPRFRGDCSERTFVLRVAHNRGLTYRTRRPRLYPLETAGMLVDPEADVSRNTERAAAREQLMESIRGLPLTQREVVMLHLEGLSHREIAEVVGTSENAAATRLARAKKTLRAALGDETRGQ